MLKIQEKTIQDTLMVDGFIERQYLISEKINAKFVEK